MMVPRVHLNGTSKAALVEQIADVCHQLNRALAKMKHAYPNGRDYYVQDDARFSFASGAALRKAVEEHEARARAVKAVLDEYDQILFGIEEQ